MKFNKNYILLGSALFVLLLSSTFLETPIENELATDTSTGVDKRSGSLLPSASYTDHAPIEIDSDAGFTGANGVSAGDGSVSDPFIIENWNITGTNRGIYIHDTTAFFVIRNCRIDVGSAEQDTAIYLFNTTGGTALIEDNYCETSTIGVYLYLTNGNTLNNNTFTGCNTGISTWGSNFTVVSNNNCSTNHRGIDIDTSTNCSLVNNICNDNSGDGIALSYSESTSLDSNICSNNNGGSGIYVESSSYSSLINNTCNSNEYGIYLYELSNNCMIIDNNVDSNSEPGLILENSHNNSLINNDCTNNDMGFEISDSSFNVVDGNNCSGSNSDGIYLSFSNNNTLSNNFCDSNGFYGLVLWDSDNNSLTNNIGTNNGVDGIFLDNSHNCMIMKNTLDFNSNGGLGLEASHNNFLVNNECTNSIEGLYVKDTENTTVSDNFIAFNDNSGLLLTNAPHSILINNTCISNTDFGIFLDFSSFILVSANNCSLNGEGGIGLVQSSNNSVVDNDCTSNGEYGINLYRVDNNTIEENNCVNNDDNIYLDEAHFATVKNNFCDGSVNADITLYDSYNVSVVDNFCYSESMYGIQLYQAENGTLENNFCRDNLYGIYLEYSDKANLESNTVLNNGNGGLYIESSSNSSIVSNVIIDSGTYGIELTAGSDDNVIDHNFLLFNDVSPQALDDGVDNLWYDGSVNEGNYWTDYGGTGSYSIDGTAGTADLYPLFTEISVEHFLPAVEVELGSIDNTIEWTIVSSLYVSEYTSLEYCVYQNGTEVSSGEFTDSDNFVYSFEGAALGVYNLTIIVTDAFDMVAMNSAFVTVSDTIAPLIDSPGDLNYTEGETGNTINWTASDLDAGNYTVYQNGTEVFSGGWTSGAVILIDMDGLDAGIYNFTIVVEDGSGNFAVDMVIVEVSENAPQKTSGWLFVLFGVLELFAFSAVVMLILKGTKPETYNKIMDQMKGWASRIQNMGKSDKTS